MLFTTMLCDLDRAGTLSDLESGLVLLVPIGWSGFLSGVFLTPDGVLPEIVTSFGKYIEHSRAYNNKILINVVEHIFIVINAIIFFFFFFHLYIHR